MAVAKVWMHATQPDSDCRNRDRDKEIAMVRHFTRVRVLILTDMNRLYVFSFILCCRTRMRTRYMPK